MRTPRESVHHRRCLLMRGPTSTRNGMRCLSRFWIPAAFRAYILDDVSGCPQPPYFARQAAYSLDILRLSVPVGQYTQEERVVRYGLIGVGVQERNMRLP